MGCFTRIGYTVILDWAVNARKLKTPKLILIGTSYKEKRFITLALAIGAN